MAEYCLAGFQALNSIFDTTKGIYLLMGTLLYKKTFEVQ